MAVPNANATAGPSNRDQRGREHSPDALIRPESAADPVLRRSRCSICDRVLAVDPVAGPGAKRLSRPVTAIGVRQERAPTISAALNCREASELAIASTRRRLEPDYRFGTGNRRGRWEPRYRNATIWIVSPIPVEFPRFRRSARARGIVRDAVAAIASPAA